MPEKDENVSKHNHGEEYMKVPLVIYVDTESLLGKIDTCHNNPEKPSTTKINNRKVCGFSSFTSCSFDTAKSTHNCCRGEECSKNFCKDLREHTTEIINYKKEMIPQTKQEKKSYRKQKFCYMCK